MTAGQNAPSQLAGHRLPADRATFAAPRVDAPPTEAVVARGYDPGFLGTRIDIPELDAAIEADAVRLDGSPRIDYTHFSLALSRSRRFAFWVAWNIDGAAMKRVARVGIEFVKDPRLPAEAQVGNELYLRNRLDRGHLARRADLLWGSMSEAEQANVDSFFYTNITPQMDDFNQSSRHGVWGELENAVFADVDIDDLKVSVFGGPVFRADDRVHRDVALPREYWKVICYVERNRLRAKAFLLTQHVGQLEALELDEFRVFQVPLSDIEARARLRFSAPLRVADSAATTESTEQYIPLETTADITW